MQKKMGIPIVLGLFMIAIYFIVDRFIVELPNLIAIPVMILAIVFILFGFLKSPKDMAK